ncbi:ATP-dependent DNA helicase [Halorientalis litorea]|uniref:ATP-dependent DNA helicase n=1 Tax=Halorientalis litorea TaxID=2931977 RepID=UPI001FF6C05B|nr:ATP-dependent DNA helicase [Halorientalis litorea]
MATQDDGYMRFFPYEEAYDHQRDAMSRISDALGDGADVLFEGATGTGKTLAALVPALEHARETDKTVVITTNVHQQTRQFIEEARAITRQESIRTVVFRGKGSMCHIDVGYEECQALRDTTRDVVEAEADRADLERRQSDLLTESQAGDEEAAEARQAVMDELDAVEDELEQLREEGNTCEYYYENLTADTDEFYDWLFADVRDPEDIYEYAEMEGFCGYELLKEGMEGVDLVVCNYNHLLDPAVREHFFRWLGRDPEDIVAVFDEAHNVEDAARDHATRTLTETTLDSALDELSEQDGPGADAAANVVDAFRTALVETYDDAFAFGEREAVGEDWYDLTIANEEGRDDLTLAFLQAYTGPGIEQDIDRALTFGRALDEQYEEAYKDGETSTRQECQTLQAAQFLATWMDEGTDAGRYPVVGVRRRGGGSDGRGGTGDGEVYGRAELYTCIPEQVTRSLFDTLHASVLMSATLRPFDVTEDVLGLDDPETMAYGAQFPEERRRTYAVEAPALFASERDDPGVQATVTGTLEDAIAFTPGNTLAFFPSYSEAERYHDRTDVDATCFLDEPGVRAKDLRERFTDHDDAALFTSLWGTLAEGVSFDDDDARTVVVVGVPYPHLDDRMEAVQAAYDESFGVADGADERSGTADAGWEYAVEIPTVRKTRQALGRVVRSPTDFGSRILVDKRYTTLGEREMGEYTVRETFPPEERREMIDIDPEKLRFAMLNFYTDMDAYGGDPPTP